MLDTYTVTDDDLRQNLISLRRSANQKGWWHQYRDTLSPALLDLIGLESDARSFRVFESLRIPALLQTEDYIRALIAASVSPPDNRDLDESVTVRLTRQALLLSQPEAPGFWAIISEAALRQNVGGPATMRGQLRRLVEVAQLKNVMLQVLPDSAGATPGLDGPFTLLEVGEYSELVVVFVESLTRGWYLEDDDDLRRYTVAFDQLCAAALSQTNSLALIERVASDL